MLTLVRGTSRHDIEKKIKSLKKVNSDTCIPLSLGAVHIVRTQFLAFLPPSPSARMCTHFVEPLSRSAHASTFPPIQVYYVGTLSKPLNKK